MRKILLLVIAAMMVTVDMSAQDEWKNEIAIAYGAGANTDIVSSIATAFFSGGKQSSFWGPISVEYFYRPDSKLGFGGIAAISGCKWKHSDNAKTTYFTLMPAIKYNWLNKSHFSMYSKGAIGATLASNSDGNESKTKVSFNWQASLIGMEFGGAFRGFVELGMGEQGVALAGLRYKF